MNHRSKKAMRIDLRGAVVAALLCSLLAGCGGDPGGSTGGGDASSTPAVRATLPEALALQAEPSDAKSVAAVVAELNGKAPVVVRGRVGIEGKEQAWFTLVDLAQKGCVDMGDECKTPWDYCCTPADVLAKESATVEFRSEGKLAKGCALGFHGLDHLKEVVVRGEASKDAAGNVTIVADGVWVKP